MSDSIDRVLNLIDDGLQSSPEHGYGLDARGLCARCQRHEPAEGEFCEGCRALLLEDSDKDPADRPGDSRLHPTVTIIDEVHEMPDGVIREAMARWSRNPQRSQWLSDEQWDNCIDEARIPHEYIERPEDDIDTRWRRRAEYARFLRRPLRVTPQQYDEIRRLEPYSDVPVYDLQQDRLFGVPLVVEEPQPEIGVLPSFERYRLNRWADGDRIQFRAEILAERAIGGRDGIYDLGTSEWFRED